MPLVTQITRDGELLQLPWGDFHIAAMALAAVFDTAGEDRPGEIHLTPDEVYDTDQLRFDCYPDAAFPVTREIAFEMACYTVLARTPLNFGEYTLRGKHKFLDLEDGEVLTLLPGDALRAVRH